MAPKPRVQKRKTREEEGRKKKAVAPSSSSSPLGKTPLSTRTVALGRNIDFLFLEEEGFSIGKKIINLGWETFCSLNLETATDLVREFYHNFHSSFNLITSNVKGVEIQINTNVLITVLNLPIVQYFDDSDVDRKTKLELILQKENVGILDKIELKDLSVEMRVLHHIACKIISPRSGRYDYISEQDISIMYCVLAELPLNLPAQIMDSMCEAVRRSKSVLPYGMLLTKIFQTYGIELDGETLSPLLHTDTFNIHTFRRMGFLKINEIWTTREDRALGIPEEEEEDVRPPSPPAHSSPAHEPVQQPPSVPVPEAQSSTFLQTSQIIEYRLPEDQLDRLALKVADILRGTVSPSPSSVQQEIVPHSSQIAGSLTEIQRKLDIVEYEIVRIRARLTGLESQVTRITTPTGPTHDQIVEVSELSNEAARLRGVVLEGISQMKDTTKADFLIHNLQDMKVQIELLRSTFMDISSSAPTTTHSAGSSRRRRRRRDLSSDSEED